MHVKGLPDVNAATMTLTTPLEGQVVITSGQRSQESSFCPSAVAEKQEPKPSHTRIIGSPVQSAQSHRKLIDVPGTQLSPTPPGAKDQPQSRATN
jgi:hypothetical protein